MRRKRGRRRRCPRASADKRTKQARASPERATIRACPAATTPRTRSNRQSRQQPRRHTQELTACFLHRPLPFETKFSARAKLRSRIGWPPRPGSGRVRRFAKRRFHDRLPDPIAVDLGHRLAAADPALCSVGRRVLFRQDRGAGNPDADAGVRPRRHRRRHPPDADATDPGTAAARPRDLADPRRDGGAQQRSALRADRMGTDPYHYRPRRDPQRHEPAVRRVRRPCADRRRQALAGPRRGVDRGIRRRCAADRARSAARRTRRESMGATRLPRRRLLLCLRRGLFAAAARAAPAHGRDRAAHHVGAVAAADRSDLRHAGNRDVGVACGALGARRARGALDRVRVSDLLPPDRAGRRDQCAAGDVPHSGERDPARHGAAERAAGNASDRGNDCDLRRACGDRWTAGESRRNVVPQNREPQVTRWNAAKEAPNGKDGAS